MKALILCLLITSTLAYPTFEEWMVKYDKHYRTIQEWSHAYNNFQNSVKFVERMNAKNGPTMYGLNQFSDLSPEEFKSTILMEPFVPAETQVDSNTQIDSNTQVNLEETKGFDWRNKHPPVVTPVYNQLMCGSCWAFSAVENVESQYALNNYPLTQFSVQEVVDCDSESAGCMGGDPVTAYKMLEHKKIETDYDYPYEGISFPDSCKYNSSEGIVKVAGWAYVVKDKNETQMVRALLNKGPLSVCVAASTWQYYKSGVITDCNTEMDHCVMVTGFGLVKQDGKEYPVWNVRNSWGTSWGMDGYAYVERGTNMCLIASHVTSSWI